MGKCMAEIDPDSAMTASSSPSPPFLKTWLIRQILPFPPLRPALVVPANLDYPGKVVGRERSNFPTVRITQ